ncbi:YceI family protein [Arthrobacter sp. KNU-44]|uniref:YceI family protein n=1 Tax=Arthrobacter sp. KNU-44 TaxID=3450744 RepID=UPI003F442700
MNDRPGGDHSRIVNHVLAPPVGTFDIDPVHTFVAFSAQHLVVGTVRGRFEAVQGTIVVADDLTESSVEVSIETSSLTTLNPVRDDDLRSENYLDVRHYPTMTFRSTAAFESTAGVWQVTGDLTLHGVTRPVELTVRFGGAVTDASGNVRIAFHAHASITRRDFGLTFELLKEAGGLLVGKDIAIDIDAEAIRPL